MSNFITAKKTKTEDQSISDLFLAKVMKDKIFHDILNKFAKGQKLERYDHYTKEEAHQAYLKKQARLNKKEEKGPDLLQIEREKLLK